jgi:hypothetical protein
MEHPGAKWEGRAGVILNKFIELDGQYILFRKIDYATEDEIDEFKSLAPYHPIADFESYTQEALEYLNKMLPNMPDEDKETAARGYIFKCVACHRHYPVWWISKKDWQNSFPGIAQTFLDKIGFGIDGEFKGIYLCKDCFEEMQESPKYMTIDQYIADRFDANRQLTEEGKARMRRVLSQIWDLPAA